VTLADPCCSPTKQYGTTPPINTNPPTKEDTERNAELVEELKNQNCFEAKAESEKRYVLLRSRAAV
jgi:poly(A) polymerase